jgi:hypothetical protein
MRVKYILCLINVCLTRKEAFKSRLKYCLYIVIRRVITVFTVFRLLTDFVCLYNYEFGLSLCKIVRSSVILLLPLYTCNRTIFGPIKQV